MPNAKRSLQTRNRKTPRKAEPKQDVPLRNVQDLQTPGSPASVLPEESGMAERSSAEELLEHLRKCITYSGLSPNEFAQQFSKVDPSVFMGQNRSKREMVNLKRRSADMVNHPAHYGGDTEHEVIRCLKAWGLESDALLWNAVKYIARSAKKGRQIEDLQKASFYLSRRIEALRSGDSAVAAGSDGAGSPG